MSTHRLTARTFCAFLLWSICIGWTQPSAKQIREERRLQKLQQPPEVFIGERLFLETRFAQFFYTNCSGEINKPLPKGDPILATIIIPGRNYPSPFVGKSMSCRVCHLVDEMEEEAGMRTYADFAKRSPIPRREDGKTTTVRNSQSLVNALIPRPGPIFLHYDGEFLSAQALIFRGIPVKTDARFVDLGLWSMFADPAQAETRRAVRQFLFGGMKGSDSKLLTEAVGRFKVPSLRDLGHSAPYFHDGSAASLTQAIAFYEQDNVQTLSAGRANPSRSGPPSAHVKQLIAFLLSLNEDYD